MKRTLMTIGFAFFAGAASSQSLLVNSDFEADLTGWTIRSSPAPVWDTFDIDGSAMSGSAMIANVLAGANTEQITLSQCFDLPLPAQFEFGVSGYIPSGQSTTGSVIVRLNQHRDPNCSGGLGGTSGQFVVQSPTTDSWTGVLDTQILLTDVDSILFEIAIRKTDSGGMFIAFVDAAVLGQQQLIFVDGFEE